MRASASTAKDLGMPAIYLHTLAQLLRSIGIDDRSLLLRVGLDPDRLNATELRVSQAQASEFVTRAIIESGEPGLGILLAQAMQPPTHGALGTAVMSSRNLGEALDLLTRYLTLRAPHWHVRKRLTQGQAWYTVTSEVDPGPLHNLILDAVLLGCVSMGTQLTGTPGDRHPDPAPGPGTGLFPALPCPDTGPGPLRCHRRRPAGAPGPARPAPPVLRRTTGGRLPGGVRTGAATPVGRCRLCLPGSPGHRNQLPVPPQAGPGGEHPVCLGADPETATSGRAGQFSSTWWTRCGWNGPENC